ncbi:nitroreductase [Ignisphaera aggregans DSM 17230]|uniref:Nitroreductase n=1 Tax=Ignisphaera aggregans (strain DSM 17230 / JCM 13409 / AQ1.S1) TaxID=583356 RepID=E0SQS6_IGNAA|nr:nitroreductase [Ignisphaera aggregans DSM 17230]
MSQKSDEYINFILTRRSIRKFKDIPIDMNLIKRILDVARYAPSAGNRQPWIFIVVKDIEVKERLAKIHRWAYPLEKAPLGIVVACNKDISPDSYHVDCANATMYIMFAAHALGLGTVWLQTLRNIEDIQKILGLPSNYIPIAMLAIGYPDESPSAKNRKPLEEIAFLDRYGNPFK